MRLFISIFLIFCSFSFFSQELIISGKCVDKNGKKLEGTLIYCKKIQADYIQVTDSLGNFQFRTIAQDSLFLEFIYFNEKTEKLIIVNNRKEINLGFVKFSFDNIDVVKIVNTKIDPFELPLHPYIDYQKNVFGVEHTLALTTAATSNNELTSNYNVRGGSYDENLVYVNGFNINRPFLTRTGQQEGLSFIYSSLVKDLRFSGGGFDSQYGDKLSSVLDITYKTPTKFKGSVMGSLLGIEAHVENKINERFDFIGGVRYRANGYLLNALPTKGAYNPVFIDAQFLTNYAINENVTWSVIGHFSSNDYRFAPQTSETDFGLGNEAYRFKIYFEGQEKTLFQTMTTGTSLKWQVNKKMKLNFYATYFHTDEREYYDILGQYFLNQLETDQTKENFGDSISTLGVGSFLNHARNRLNASVLNLYHDGEYQLFSGTKNGDKSKIHNHKLRWGVNFEIDRFKDVISDWSMIDSAGYSLPYVGNEILSLNHTIKSNLNLSNSKYTGFSQMNSTWSKIKYNLPVSVSRKIHMKDSSGKVVKSVVIFKDTLSESTTKLALNYGFRIGYTDVNNEFYLTPRLSLTYFPRVFLVENDKLKRRDVRYRLSTGLYYQPPMYREFRTAEGKLNLNVKSQKSAHFVLGTDVYFNMWGRKHPFKFTAEAYYKYMWDINPYSIENVRTIYMAENIAKAYACGLDLNVNGQFIEGIETFFKVGLLSTKEDLKSDFYYNYINSDGEIINSVTTVNKKVVDSAIVYPGYIPRPTDQRFNFGALIQDRMPNYESISVQVGLQFGTSLPYGPPTGKRYQAVLRQKSYFRVDIGTSYDLLYKHKDNFHRIRKYFTDAIISFEVFNLLGINNVLSHQWIQTTDGLYYPVPNYLTQRRFNLKMILRF
ncbi:MAG: hypothetical protein HYR91_07730 [Flavobacteriia bacterium]|nr:hypothetical protein [Flavobacteriia bacterium]